MIVPPDEVILLRRECLELQSKLEEVAKKMQGKCDHDLICEVNDSSSYKYRICEICGRVEQNSAVNFAYLITDRPRMISRDEYIRLQYRLSDMKFYTYNERPVKEVIE